MCLVASNLGNAVTTFEGRRREAMDISHFVTNSLQHLSDERRHGLLICFNEIEHLFKILQPLVLREYTKV